MFMVASVFYTYSSFNLIPYKEHKTLHYRLIFHQFIKKMHKHIPVVE